MDSPDAPVRTTAPSFVLPDWQPREQPPHKEVLVVNCFDGRLINAFEQVFSEEMRIPSLKFALAAAWAVFVGLGMVGSALSNIAPALSHAIAMLLLSWVGMMLALFGPLYVVLQIPNGALVVLPVVLVLSAILATQILKFATQVSRLVVTPERIAVHRGVARWSRHWKTYDWGEVRGARLEPGRSADPRDRQLELLLDNNRVLRIRLGSIESADQLSQFVSAIQRFAHKADVDPELLQVWNPAYNTSYTEVWLQSLAAPPKRARMAPLEPGMTLQNGRLRVLSQIAAGGQAVIYRATTTDAGGATSDEQEIVILKEFILPIYGDENVRERENVRFSEEAGLLQRLNNPQIVRLIDVFIEDHRGYLVLEHIDGLSLSRLVEEKGKQQPAEAVRLALQMCDILGYLHGLEPPIVHRDFSPDNLMLTEDGVLKLIDFNVACESKYTTTATIVGKHAYLPPEQFRGKPCPQSDIYAFGGTLHYLLTGQQPEPLTESHPAELVPELSPDLDRIVSRATALELDQRYPSITEVRRDLDRLILPPSADLRPDGGQ